MIVPGLPNKSIANFARSLLLCGAAVFALIGCGGGGGGGASSSTVSPAGKGSISFTVKWPAVSRIIPSQANEIVITVYAPGTSIPPPANATVVTGLTITRPQGSTQSLAKTYTLGNLPPTTVLSSGYVLDIAAYDATSPTSLNATLAYAYTFTNVTAGQNTIVNVTLASTLAYIGLQNVPSRGNGTVPASAPLYVSTAGLLSLAPTSSSPYPSNTVPLDASTAGTSTVIITPYDQYGDVLLLAPNGGPSGTTTSVFQVANGTGGTLTLTTPPAGGTSVPANSISPTFGLATTGTEGTDSFTVNYTDDGTTTSFIVPVNVTADVAPWVSLSLKNTPPDFDSSLNVTSSATITDTTPGGDGRSYSYSATPTTSIPTLPPLPSGWPTTPPAPVVYGNNSVVFTFYNVKVHQQGFVYSFSLDGQTTGGTPVVFKTGSVTTPTAPVSIGSSPPVLSGAPIDVSGYPMLLSSFPPSGVSNPNSVTLNRTSGAPSILTVSASFGSAAQSFPANLFTVGAGTDTTPNPGATTPPFTAWMFSQYAAQSAPAGYPSGSLSQLTPTTTLDFFTRTATLPLGMLDRNSQGNPFSLSITGTFNVTAPPNAGTLSGGAG